MSQPLTNFDNWSREELVAHLVELENEKISSLRRSSADYLHRTKRVFDSSVYPRRKIALKFCYHGSHYAGLEYQPLLAALPTVEGVLYDSLVRTRLIDPAAGFAGCEWEKCGRTDKGVSAAGQVISLWVRSFHGEVQNREEDRKTVTVEASGEQEPLQEDAVAADGPGLEGDLGMMGDWDDPPTNSSLPPPAKIILDFPYISKLNKVLPPTLRVIAWSPVADDFSARYSCRWRHYKYFFHSHGLDLAAMREAASRLVGEHDFRNLCKIDATKQLSSFNRRILSAEINPVDGDGYMCVLDLRGRAFLYNQVRHIMAVLFLVGTRLEHPSIIDALLNVDPDNPQPASRTGEPSLPVVARKPVYQMADPLPLVLWDAGYDVSDVAWRAGADDGRDETIAPKHFVTDLHHDLKAQLHRSEINRAISSHFLHAAAKFHEPPPQYFPIGGEGARPIERGNMLSIPLGAGLYHREAGYVPLLERKSLDLPEEINERWRTGKGAKQLERRSAATTGRNRR